MRDPKGFYPIPEIGPDVKFPSVTTILGILRKYQLEDWQIGVAVDYLYDNTIGPLLAGDMTYEQLTEMDIPKTVADAKRYHKEISGEAMDYGSRIHKALDDYDKTGEAPTEPDIVDQFKEVLEWSKGAGIVTIETEKMIYSKTHQYAGTVDKIATLGTEDNVGILDYKSFNGKRPVIYPNWKQQLAAYVYAYEEMSGTVLGWGGILTINRQTGEAKPYIYTRGELVQPTMEFLALAFYFNLTRRGK